jgi:hypothetical protein
MVGRTSGDRGSPKMHFPRHPLRGTAGQRQLTKRRNACRFQACCGVVRNVYCDVSAPSGLCSSFHLHRCQRLSNGT